MSHLTFYTDRTSIETDWTCEQSHYWRTYHNGTGMVPAQEPEYFLQGRTIHADYAAVMTGSEARPLARRLIEDVLAIPDVTQMALEQAWWHAGMVLAFAKYIAPKWMATYDVWLVEKEIVLNRPPLALACTIDLALKSKPGLPPRRIITDYKSVRWLTKGWTDHWPYAVQMQINPKAVEEWSGERVDATYVVGLQKGEFRKGLLRHPYIYAYATADGTEWVGEWKANPFALRGVWEMGMGPDRSPAPVDIALERLEGWVEKLGEGVAIEQHPMSLPVFENERMMERLIEDQIRREHEIRDGLAKGAHPFRANFKACKPEIGSACAYLAACWNEEVNRDPLGSGLYVPRTPHHDQEWLMKESQ